MSQITEAPRETYHSLIPYADKPIKNATLHYCLGIYYNDNHYNTKQALKHFLKSHGLDAQNEGCIILIAALYYQIANYKQSNIFFGKLAKIRELENKELRMASWAAQKADDYKTAVAHYAILLQSYPNETNLLINQGYCFGKLHLSEKSLECSLKAYNINPNDYIALLNIGFRYWVLQDLVQARFFTEKSLRASYDYSLALMNMGHICWCEGNLDEAKSYYRRSRKTMHKDKDFKKLMLDDAQYIVPYGIQMNTFEQVLVEVMKA